MEGLIFGILRYNILLNYILKQDIQIFSAL